MLNCAASAHTLKALRRPTWSECQSCGCSKQRRQLSFSRTSNGKARSFGSVLFLFNPNGVGLVQTQDLPRFQRNVRFRIDNLLSINLDTALFDQAACFCS